MCRLTPIISDGVLARTIIRSSTVGTPEPAIPPLPGAGTALPVLPVLRGLPLVASSARRSVLADVVGEGVLVRAAVASGSMPLFCRITAGDRSARRSVCCATLSQVWRQAPSRESGVKPTYGHLAYRAAPLSTAGVRCAASLSTSAPPAGRRSRRTVARRPGTSTPGPVAGGTGKAGGRRRSNAGRPVIAPWPQES